MLVRGRINETNQFIQNQITSKKYQNTFETTNRYYYFICDPIFRKLKKN